MMLNISQLFIMRKLILFSLNSSKENAKRKHVTSRFLILACIVTIMLTFDLLKGHCQGDFAVFRSILCSNHCLVLLLAHRILLQI